LFVIRHRGLELESDLAGIRVAEAAGTPSMEVENFRAGSQHLTVCSWKPMHTALAGFFIVIVEYSTHLKI